MTEFHEGQEVLVLRYTDTLDLPWTKGKITNVSDWALSTGGQSGIPLSISPDLEAVLIDGDLCFFEKRFIRAI